MPLLGRENGRGPRTRRSDDEFVVFLQGIPAHCRWQELKDLVRQTALHIRQAVVYDDSHGFPTGLGQIIVKNEDEAWRTYHRLSTNGWDGQSLIVTLARTSGPTKPIAGPTRSPPAMIGRTTPPRSRGNMTVPSSPITPESAHSASPAYTYAEYGSMMSPMTTMPPPPFMPIMSDPMIHSMHSFPPSPLTHCSVYDASGWNMMPMYPGSPIQPLYDAGDCYASYHQRKTQPSGTEPSTPSDSNQRAIYTKNLSSFSIPAGREHYPLQGAITIEQGRMTDPHDNQFQRHSSAMTSSIEENKQAAPVLDNTTFTSSSSRYSANPDQGPSMNMTRSGSWEWEGAMTSSHEDPEARDPVAGDDCDGCSGRGQAVQGEKIAGSSQPLVVDGSGLRNGHWSWS